jgi:hypothetical protein
VKEATIDDRRLTGDQLSGLHDAVLDAYPARTGLEKLFFYRLEKELNTLAGDGGMEGVVLQVLRSAKAQGWLARFIDAVLADRADNPALRRWAEQCGWHSRAAQPLPPPDQQLLDSAFFDLQELRWQIRAARDAAAGPVLGLGLHDTDYVVVRKVCDWLPYCLDDIKVKDPLALRPDLGSVDAWVKKTLAYLPDLDLGNLACPIIADRTPAHLIAEYWDSLRQHIGGQHQYWFVAIFTGSVEGGVTGEDYPAEIKPLAAPVIERHHLDDWTEQTVRRLRWPTPLAKAWTQLIVNQCWDGTKIDAHMMYVVMDRSIGDVRHRQEAFRQQLEELT